MFAFNGYAWGGFDSKVGSPTFCVTISGANKLSIEVLDEYVWLDADGVTRSKTMTMTARPRWWIVRGSVFKALDRAF